MKILDIPRSGSYAGITSSRNRFGQYVRNRRAPVQPIGTGRRAFIRSAFGNASTSWAGLTAEEQEAWIQFRGRTPGHKFPGCIGHAHRPSNVCGGRNSACKCSVLRPVCPRHRHAVHSILSVAVVVSADNVFTVAVDSSAAGGQESHRGFAAALGWQARSPLGSGNNGGSCGHNRCTDKHGSAVSRRVRLARRGSTDFRQGNTSQCTEGWTGTPVIVSAIVLRPLDGASAPGVEQTDLLNVTV